ncbi:MAG TPA: RNA polymerase sigma-70 factor [Gemmatimonadaceae bacterium]|jgi:RNA polymerase sigma-70 factor (ECF subfamily)|nr:RNA polymerase sigma-70 factor [Gemmatimonadaceae bacterium]
MSQPVSTVQQSAARGASPDDDHRWLDASNRADIAAFERLFRSFAADLVAFAESYVGSEDEAEEVVHVVFCWLWEHRFTLERPKSVRSYMFAAVRNRALNAVRDKRTETAFRERIARAASSGTLPSAPAPDSELASRDLAHALAKSLREMPVRCREVYTLVREQGLTYAEVADALGIAPKTVEIHMSRSLAILRQRLAPWLGNG